MHQVTSDHCPCRTPAIKALNATGQANLSLEALFQTSSLGTFFYLVRENDVHIQIPLIIFSYTIYTTVMSAANPEKYMTRIRNPG
ncbi:N-acylethanolamine-hydrolyzing acid amidase [Camelus dromedarius]|uniref:N-acylethanolamine-hydrolyzing acid amidase n=1 Tax=Camelus dromedarius TaxID=9838 RepID=A0A5N4EGH0_CAMDR|nr:N-acylethanolamine-hydrolyzing acid amidase [Camelus dromedarius]